MATCLPPVRKRTTKEKFVGKAGLCLRLALGMTHREGENVFADMAILER